MSEIVIVTERQLYTNSSSIITTTDQDIDSDVEDKKQIETKKWICKVCNQSYEKKSRLESHFRSHSGERPYLCSYNLCNKSFTRSDHLSRHSKSHTGDRHHRCSWNDCEQQFLTPAHLKRHILTHMKDKEIFPCPSCSNSYDKKSTLRNHRLMDHGDPEFCCEYDGCNKYFPSASKLQRHLQQHASERYSCKEIECEYDASSFIDLKHHLQSVHHYPTKSTRISTSQRNILTESESGDSDNNMILCQSTLKDTRKRSMESIVI